MKLRRKPCADIVSADGYTVKVSWDRHYGCYRWVAFHNGVRFNSSIGTLTAWGSRHEAKRAIKSHRERGKASYERCYTVEG